MAGGRQRQFDEQQALKSAMRVFWKKGYAGASLSDLTTGMGINKPSLYATFGNKEQLFVQATEYYIEHYATPHITYLQQENVSLGERLKGYLFSALRSQCDEEEPKGCYISLCVSESAGECLPEEAFDTIEKARDFTEAFLTSFLEEEKNKGNLPARHNSGELALYLVTLLHGTAALARGGKKITALKPVIERALLALEL